MSISELYTGEAAEKHTRESLDWLMDSAPMAKYTLDTHGLVTTWSLSAERIFGWSESEIVGHPSRVMDPEGESTHDMGSARWGLEFVTLNGKLMKRKTKSGATIDTIMWASPQKDDLGNIVGIEVYATVDFHTTALYQDLQRLIEEMSHRDGLTGLPNRMQFGTDLREAVRQCSMLKRRLGLLLLDIDGFKYVNDAFGHSVGDAALREMSRRLLKKQSDEVRCYRVGGDEFAILMMVEDLREANRVAEELLAENQNPMQTGDATLVVRCSMGIAMYPEDGARPDVLTRNADVAMYTAKELGGNRCCTHSGQLRGKYKTTLWLREPLRKAVEGHEFEFHYQPKMHAATGELLGAEALLRWNSPRFGLVFPGSFIPYAEQSDLIWDIGEWVLRTACSQIREWRNQGLNPIILSINASMVQLERDEFVSLVEDVLSQTGVSANQLEIEITESVFAKDVRKVTRIVNRLTEMGIRIALDDFGTGYSSLQYLPHARIETLKIDKVFIHGLDETERAVQVVQGLIQMAHALNMRVVAEGVERIAEWSTLEKIGCDEIQGFLVGKPEPLDLFERRYRAVSRTDMVWMSPNR